MATFDARGGLLAWQLNRIVDYIESHLSERITAGRLAGLIRVSTSRMFRRFKVSVGVTPSEYIARRRIERICAMLKTTNQSIAQIAADCGLSDQAHLCRMFRRLMGTTPSMWRRAVRLG